MRMLRILTLSGLVLSCLVSCGGGRAIDEPPSLSDKATDEVQRLNPPRLPPSWCQRRFLRGGGRIDSGPSSCNGTDSGTNRRIPDRGADCRTFDRASSL